MNFEWKDYEKEKPTDNGRLQRFLVCKDKPSASCGNVTIETEFFTDKFQDDRKLTHWAPLPAPPERYRKKKENDMAKVLKYSILHYCPDPISGEQMNLGIIFYEEKENSKSFPYNVIGVSKYNVTNCIRKPSKGSYSSSEVWGKET